jgi:hypothetical protein
MINEPVEERVFFADRQEISKQVNFQASRFGGYRPSCIQQCNMMSSLSFFITRNLEQI